MTATTIKTMCMGELVARTWHGLRTNPRGIPVWHLRRTAREHGHDSGQVLHRVLAQGKVVIVHQAGMRWLAKGPRWDPATAASEPA